MINMIRCMMIKKVFMYIYLNIFYFVTMFAQSNSDGFTFLHSTLSIDKTEFGLPLTFDCRIYSLEKEKRSIYTEEYHFEFAEFGTQNWQKVYPRIIRHAHNEEHIKRVSKDIFIRQKVESLYNNQVEGFYLYPNKSYHVRLVQTIAEPASEKRFTLKSEVVTLDFPLISADDLAVYEWIINNNTNAFFINTYNVLRVEEGKDDFAKTIIQVHPNSRFADLARLYLVNRYLNNEITDTKDKSNAKTLLTEVEKRVPFFTNSSLDLIYEMQKSRLEKIK